MNELKDLINARVRQMQISGIRQFANLVAQYDDVISLTIGQPDFHTPSHVKKAGKTAIDDNRTTYTPNAGLLEARQAVSHYMFEKYGLNYQAEDEIIITNGASEAIAIALQTVVTEGSEVLLPAPVYPGYEPLIRLFGGVPVYIDTRDSGFRLTAGQIKENLTERSRAVILPYPSNPTGVTLQPQQLEHIAQILREHNLFVIADEIYSELVYDRQGHTSIASFPGLREKTVVINGLSKSHAMTGWRIGFTLAPSYLTEQMLKVHQYTMSCASSISQYAAMEALTNGLHDARAMNRQYEKRKEYVYGRLAAMGLDTVRPQGAFYVFPSIERFQKTSFDFANEMLRETRVAVVPGSAFSRCGEGFVRISYACSMETLKEGLDRFERFVKSL